VLVSAIDSSVLVGYPAAQKYLGFDGHPSTIYLRAQDVLLGLLGGAVGVALGVGSTVVYADTKGWAAVVPTVAWAGGIAASVIIGAVAGLMPALRAARLSPTQALWSV
jgi:putative ABC transport system permease protein